MSNYWQCAKCGEWIDVDSEHHVTGYVGYVNRQRVHLHADWCADVFEGNIPLADRTEHNRKRRVINDER
jgi:hypothetical protein